MIFIMSAESRSESMRKRLAFVFKKSNLIGIFCANEIAWTHKLLNISF